MFRLSLKALSQAGILGRDSNRAGIFVALANHNAAERYENCRRKAEFLGSEERAYYDVSAGFQLSVNLHADFVA